MDASDRALADLGLMTRTICHELNNLLASAQGYAQLLRHHGALPPAALRWLDALAESGQDMQGLVKQVQARARWQELQAPSGHHAGRNDAIEGLIGALRARGVVLGAPGLRRLIELVWASGVAAQRQPPALREDLPPQAQALLGVLDPDRAMVVLDFGPLWDRETAEQWQSDRHRLIPDDGAAEPCWQRALALCLLRQSGAELFQGVSGLTLQAERTEAGIQVQLAFPI